MGAIRIRDRIFVTAQAMSTLITNDTNSYVKIFVPFVPFVKFVIKTYHS